MKENIYSPSPLASCTMCDPTFTTQSTIQYNLFIILYDDVRAMQIYINIYSTRRTCLMFIQFNHNLLEGWNLNDYKGYNYIFCCCMILC